MKRDDALGVLKRNEAELRRRGIRHASLFGSVARGDAGPHSDVDVMIDLDPSVTMSVFDYVEIVEFVQGLFDGSADVSNRAMLRDHVRSRALRDAIDAF